MSDENPLLDLSKVEGALKRKKIEEIAERPRLVIEMVNDKFGVQVNGPIGNEHLCCLMLEAARLTISEFNRKQREEGGENRVLRAVPMP